MVRIELMDLPPPQPALTIEQTADLKCLGLGLFLAKSTGDRSPPMVRIFLTRLRKADPARDWRAIAPTFSDDMLYGEFMGVMNECAVRANPSNKPPPPPEG